MPSRCDIIRFGELSHETLRQLLREALEDYVSDTITARLKADPPPKRRRTEAVSPLGERNPKDNAARKTLRAIVRTEVARLRNQRIKQ